MFLSFEAKKISDAYHTNSLAIRKELKNIFESAIIGTSNELNFINKLVKEFENNYALLSPNGYKLNINSAIIHHKPIVSYIFNGNIIRCELGDMLVTIKYHLSSGAIETKSIIYQIKLAKGDSDKCIIDNDQLVLMSYWPSLYFGKKSDGGQKEYRVFPITLEFGSYMLELRSPKSENRLKYYKSYGTCPYAIQIMTYGPKEIYLNKGMYCRCDYSNIFSQLAFDIGESHINTGICNLVEALYRYIGMAPDPPHEFDEYSNVIDGDGFSVMEINVIPNMQG